MKKGIVRTYKPGAITMVIAPKKSVQRIRRPPKPIKK